MLLMPIYVQTIRGISPFDSGLLILPGAIVMEIMSPITGILFDKIGARILAITGSSLTILTMFIFINLTMDISYGYIMFIYTLHMLGMSMMMMPVITNGLNQLPPAMNPHGTAMNNTLQQVSGAVGSAFLVTLMQNRTESESERLAESAAGDPAAMANLANEAMLNGINFSFTVSVFIAISALVLSFFMKRVTPSRQQAKQQSAG